jgi:hypothetical protein
VGVLVPSEREIAPVTETKPERRRIGWPFRRSQPKSAVGAPLFGDELRLVNRTGLRWSVFLDWHALDVLEAYEDRLVQRGNTGRVTVRRVESGEIDGFLSVALAAGSCGVEIVELSGGEEYFEVRLIASGVHDAGERPDTTPIAELDLSKKAVDALREAEISTFGRLRYADMDSLLDIVNVHPEIRDELIRLMYLRRRGL